MVCGNRTPHTVYRDRHSTPSTGGAFRQYLRKSLRPVGRLLPMVVGSLFCYKVFVGYETSCEHAATIGLHFVKQSLDT